MYTLKISKGFIDETEPVAVDITGSYESLPEACEAAERAFHAILRYYIDPYDVRSGDAVSEDDFYITYGDAGYVCYYRVQVIER